MSSPCRSSFTSTVTPGTFEAAFANVKLNTAPSSLRNPSVDKDLKRQADSDAARLQAMQQEQASEDFNLGATYEKAGHGDRTVTHSCGRHPTTDEGNVSHYNSGKHKARLRIRINAAVAKLVQDDDDESVPGNIGDDDDEDSSCDGDNDDDDDNSPRRRRRTTKADAALDAGGVIADAREEAARKRDGKHVQDSIKSAQAALRKYNRAQIAANRTARQRQLHRINAEHPTLSDCELDEEESDVDEQEGDTGTGTQNAGGNAFRSRKFLANPSPLKKWMMASSRQMCMTSISIR